MLKCKWSPFFLSVQKFREWITLFGCIHVANNNCCVITFALIINSSHLSVYVSHVTVLFNLYQENESSIESAWPLQQNKNTVRCICFPFHLFRHVKTNTGNHTFASRIARILMCRYCCHVHQRIVCDSLTVYSLSVNGVMVTTFLKSIKS